MSTRYERMKQVQQLAERVRAMVSPDQGDDPKIAVLAEMIAILAIEINMACSEK